MAGVKQTVKAGSRVLQVSNLSKVLYPDSGISKAEIIQYYLAIAPYILRYIKYRPLSLIRFPDGILGEQFFQKDLPAWRPDWLTSYRIGKERKKQYVTVTEEAALAWLANLACLELHQMHFRSAAEGRPDYFVFDIDPPEDYPFDDLKEFCYRLKEHTERYGYRTYLKTSGNKGLHLFVPILQEYDPDTCFQAVRDLAEKFVRKQRSATLALRKESRKDRILVDIYRNRSSQTIISALSLRGKPHAPVSMPVSWDFLDALPASDFMHLRDVIPWLKEHGDPWEGMDAYAVPLHTQNAVQVPAVNPPGNKHKSPEQLEQYVRKRDFLRTPEPGPGPGAGKGNAFVIHRHDASHLHYDLRLESDGVLLSWAVPKGMPAIPGDKRLAVQTEDHPLEYLNFEGQIPKGEYGGGEILIVGQGRYTRTKQKKDGFYFVLSGNSLTGEFRMHRTREKEWLLERVDKPVPEYLTGFTPPMLAESASEIPGGDNYAYELKWDGIRAILVLHDGVIRVFSRSGIDMTTQFPEITDASFFRSKNGVYDGELVCLDDSGKPRFKKVMKRFQTSGESSIARRRKSSPAFLYLFDVLYADGIPLVRQPLAVRRRILETSLTDRTSFVRISEMLEDGRELFEATKELGLEGIICKDLSAAYLPGKRSDSWLKIKVRKSARVEVIGFTRGRNSLENSLGALLIAEKSGDDIIYRGKVGTGFSDRDRSRILQRFMDSEHRKKSPEYVPEIERKGAMWLKWPEKAEVRYASVNPGGIFREPVFNKFLK